MRHPSTRQPGPVALRRRRVHEPYEIGGAPIAPQRRHRGRAGQLRLAPRLGGPQPHGGPRGRRRTRMTGGPGGGRPARCIRCSRPRRSPSDPGRAPPHSSQSSSPGSSSALPAATSSRIRSPASPAHRPSSAAGAGARQRRAARLGRHVQDVEAQPRQQLVPDSVRAPSASPVRSRTSGGPIAGRGAAGERDRAGAAGATAGHARCNCRKGPGVTLGVRLDAHRADARGRAGVSGGARLFARSGGNRCARHGVSVRCG